MPFSIFEEFAAERDSSSPAYPLNSGDAKQRLLCGYATGDVFRWIKDPRIKHALLLHPSITKFKIGSLKMQHDYYLETRCGGTTGGNDAEFWQSHLKNMRNLLHLELNYMSNDSILSLVGETCKKLRIIHIASSFQLRERPSTVFPPFRATVTDFGLTALLGCNDLKRIHLDSCCTRNPGITIDGAKNWCLACLIWSLSTLHQWPKYFRDRCQEESLR